MLGLSISYGRSNSSSPTSAAPSLFSKITCARRFTARILRRYSARFVFSSHRLKMIISALDNCSIIIAFIFATYTSKVDASTNVITCTIVQPFGTRMENSLSIFHVPLYSIITRVGLYLSCRSSRYSVFRLDSSRYSTKIFWLFRYSSSYSSIPSSQTSRRVGSPSVNPRSIRVSFAKVVFPLSRKPINIYTGISSTSFVGPILYFLSSLSFTQSAGIMQPRTTLPAYLPSDCFR